MKNNYNHKIIKHNIIQHFFLYDKCGSWWVGDAYFCWHVTMINQSASTDKLQNYSHVSKKYSSLPHQDSHLTILTCQIQISRKGYSCHGHWIDTPPFPATIYPWKKILSTFQKVAGILEFYFIHEVLQEFLSLFVGWDANLDAGRETEKFPIYISSLWSNETLLSWPFNLENYVSE